MSYMHLTCGWTGPRLMPEDTCPKCGERGPWTAADESREDSVFRMLSGAFGMMVDDLSGKGAVSVDDEGLKLLKEFVEKTHLIDDFDFPFCQYCGRADDEGPHSPNCTYFRARAYLRDQGIQVKDSE